MSDEVENHTIRLLQEMRQEMREFRQDVVELRSEMNAKFDEVAEQFDDLSNRVDGNTLILNMIAGLVHDHEERVTALEDRQGQA